MGTKPFALQELRVRYPSSFTDTFTDLDDATWAAAGGSPATIKARFVNGRIDLGSLEHPRLPDPSVRTRGRGLGRGILGKQGGSVAVPLFLNAGGGTGESSILTLLNRVFGGLATPTSNSATADSAGVHTTSRIYSTGIEGKGIAAGQAVLVGARGDGRGNGEVIPVAAVGTNYVDLARTTATAAADDDVLYLSHTVYPDMDATQNYFELAMIGDDATSPDQYNLIGCQATEVAIGQINIDAGEMPIITLTVTPGRWRMEPSASKATISHAAPSGANPVALGIGGLWVTDVYSTAQTRGYLLGGEMEVNPGIVHVPLQDPQRYNNIGGWRRAPGHATWAFTAYGDEGSPNTPVNDYSDDFEDNTHAHQVMMQFGHAVNACVGIGFDRTYLDEQLKPVELNQMLAYRFSGHADERATTTDLIAADIKLHFFISA